MVVVDWEQAFSEKDFSTYSESEIIFMYDEGVISLNEASELLS